MEDYYEIFYKDKRYKKIIKEFQEPVIRNTFIVIVKDHLTKEDIVKIKTEFDCEDIYNYNEKGTTILKLKKYIKVYERE